MSRDEDSGASRRARPVTPPPMPPGPLGDLKRVLYTLYLDAGAPTLDQITVWLKNDDDLPACPTRDTVHRCLSGAASPANQHDAVAIAAVLAREAGWDEAQAVARTRDLWVQARMVTPAGSLVASLRDPIVLEVHKAIEAEAAGASLPPLPPYVHRPHDELLAAAVDQAAQGLSRIAVLVGESSTGKTRACWECVQRLPAGWRLWHPIEPGRARAVIDMFDSGRIGPHTVLWLNEMQHYLQTPDSDLGERVASGLRELLRDPARGPVLILGTLWPERWDELTEAPHPGEPDRHPQSRELLTGTSIRVPDTFSGRDLDRALAVAEDSGDPRLAEAHAHASNGRIAQYLAGVPVLLEQYRNAPRTAKAVIDAAMAARRLGELARIPHDFLREAAAGYLDDETWDQLVDERWFGEALVYAAKPCRGVAGPLT